MEDGRCSEGVCVMCSNRNDFKAATGHVNSETSPVRRLGAMWSKQVLQGQRAGARLGRRWRGGAVSRWLWRLGGGADLGAWSTSERINMQDTVCLEFQMKSTGPLA